MQESLGAWWLSVDGAMLSASCGIGWNHRAVSRNRTDQIYVGGKRAPVRNARTRAPSSSGIVRLTTE